MGGNQNEADIEDLFEPELFVQIINSAYKLDANDLLDVEKLSSADTSTTRLVKKAEAAFRTMNLSVPDFDHFTPSEWLLQNPSLFNEQNEIVENTLSRSECVFKTFNALLQS